MRHAKITDFKPDPQNPNKGSERGYRLLNDSLAEFGAGRSILVDKNGIVIAGNKTQENALDIGLEDAIVVPTDGKQMVVVQRTDLDLLNDTDHKARRLSIADNRTSDLMEWDAEVMAALQQQNMDFKPYFEDYELDTLLDNLNKFDAMEHWKDLPEYEEGEDTLKIVISFRNKSDRAEFAKLIDMSINNENQTISFWYPPKEKDDLSSVRFE